MINLAIVYPWRPAPGIWRWKVRDLHGFESWPSLYSALDDWFDKVMLQHESPDPGDDYHAWARRREWMGEDA